MKSHQTRADFLAIRWIFSYFQVSLLLSYTQHILNLPRHFTWRVHSTHISNREEGRKVRRKGEIGGCGAGWEQRKIDGKETRRKLLLLTVVHTTHSLINWTNNVYCGLTLSQELNQIWETCWWMWQTWSLSTNCSYSSSDHTHEQSQLALSL